MIATIDRLVGAAALAAALLAGAALTFVTLMTVTSIAGRNLIAAGLAPVPGDVEMVEMATAFAVTACLSWCQWKRGHVTVDIFLARLGPRFNAAVDTLTNALMTAAAALVAWRAAVGLQGKLGTGFAQETTFILGIPLWYGYAALLAGACLFTLTSAWTVIRSAHEARRA